MSALLTPEGSLGSNFLAVDEKVKRVNRPVLNLDFTVSVNPN